MKSSKRNHGVWDFFDTMLPSFERIQITEEIERVFKDTRDVTHPALDINVDTIDKTSTYSLLFNSIDRAGSKHFRGDLIKYIKEITTKTLDGKGDLIKLVEKAFNRTIVREGLDYKRGHMLHVIALLEFYNRYVIQFLLVTTKEALGDKYYPVDKSEKAFVTDVLNVRKFTALCLALENEFKNYDRLLAKVDGITMDEETREASETILGKEADPLSVGFYTVDFNPFYQLGKLFNQVYVFFFDIKREQASKLSLHIVKLKQQREDANSEALAGIDKAIAYHSNRLNKLNGEIEEVLADARDI